MADLMRIDKIISSQTMLSRSDVKKLVKQGEIVINGSVVKDVALKLDPLNSEIFVKGGRLEYKKHIYIMMNKPSGLLCVSRDNREKTVVDLVAEDLMRPGLFPAGRLDRDTVGLTLITDDGDFAHKILSPKNKVFKTYYALLEKPVSSKDILHFKEGVVLEDETLCMPARLSVIDKADNPYIAFNPSALAGLEDKRVVEIKISEGKYHQVKRMFQAVDNEVLWLKRVAMGKLLLCETLKEGESEELDFEQVAEALENVE